MLHSAAVSLVSADYQLRVALSFMTWSLCNRTSGERGIHGAFCTLMSCQVSQLATMHDVVLCCNSDGSNGLLMPTPDIASHNNMQCVGAQVFVEYVMLAGVNDGEEQAHQLGALLRGRSVVVNLIPWNPVFSPGIAFAAPDPDRVRRFHSIVRGEYSLPCTVRQEKGQDISGACGQLVVEQRNAGNRTGLPRGDGANVGRVVKDIEELVPRFAVSTA